MGSLILRLFQSAPMSVSNRCFMSTATTVSKKYQIRVSQTDLEIFGMLDDHALCFLIFFIQWQYCNMLSAMEEALHKRVRGQRAAVQMVATAVARAKAGLQETHRPIASLLLYGPPGGKHKACVCGS